MNYLQLVNEAMTEAGISPALAQADFTSPTEPMQVKFKRWVAQAWREIQMDRGEWQYMVTTSVLNISPRIYIELGDRATAPIAGYTYTTNETLQDIEILSAETPISGAWAAGDAKAFINIAEKTSPFKLNETADETSPTIANTDVFTIRGNGTYDLSTLISGYSKPILEEFYIQSTGNSSDQDNDGGADLKKLVYSEWSIFNDMYETDGAHGQPRIFTITPLGHVDFWPRLDKQYTLKVSYVPQPTELSAYSDTPDIPTEYHHAVVWKAVMFWAQYDRQVSEELRAFKNYRFYKREMDRYLKPRYTWGVNLFDG